MSVLADIQLALAAAAELKAALPALAGAVANLKQAYADKTDTTKAIADIEAAFTAVSPLIDQIVPLLPAPIVPPPPSAPAAS